MDPDTDDLLTTARLHSYVVLGTAAVMIGTALVLSLTGDPAPDQALTLLLLSLPCMLLGLCFSTLRKVVHVVRRLEDQLDDLEKRPEQT